MQVWLSSELSAAVLQDSSANQSVGKLRLLLLEVQKSYPPSINIRVTRTLGCIKRLALYNAPDCEGVWIVTAELKEAVDHTSLQIQASGYSPVESLAGLFNKIAIAQAIHSLNQSNDSLLAEVSNHPALLNYSNKLLSKLLLCTNANESMLPVRHLANRTNTVFPKILCLQTIPGVLPELTEGCAAETRQRDAISNSLCKKIKAHAFALWRYKQQPPRKSTPELKTIFEHYSKRCLHKFKHNNIELLDISLEWGPSVYVAVSIQGNDEYIVAGIGCGTSAHVGIAEAILDHRLKESNLSIALEKHQQTNSAGFSSGKQKTLQEMQGGNQLGHQLTKAERDPIREVFWPQRTFVRSVARQAESAGIDIFYSDITTADNPLSVVKIISPQLLTAGSAI